MSFRITPLTDPAHGAHSRRLAWLASDADSVPVGAAFLRLFDGGQAHLAELTLNVHPVERRKGVGSGLLDTAVAAARDNARRCVSAQAQAGSPGGNFLPARGFRKVLTLRFARLPLADVDAVAVAEVIERPHPGYRLASWQGTVPDALALTFAASRRAMDDMPMEDTDHGIVAWDVDRVRAAAKAVEERGDRLHTVVAIDTRDDSIAGFTELVVPGNGTGDGQHYGTGVLPEHRGHGLGRWMKAESIRQARGRYPGLGGLLTDTADSNTHMRHISDSLGYVPTHTTLHYQLDLQQRRAGGPDVGITSSGPSSCPGPQAEHHKAIRHPIGHAWPISSRPRPGIRTTGAPKNPEPQAHPPAYPAAMPELQRLRLDHAPALLAFEQENRAFFAASVPDRGDDYFTHFAAHLADRLAEQATGVCHFHVLVAEDGEVLGRFNLVDVADGSADLGFRLAERATGRGLATATVRDLFTLCTTAYGLTTLRAAAAVTNTASRAVLTRTGFVPTGEEPTLSGKRGVGYVRELTAGPSPR